MGKLVIHREGAIMIRWLFNSDGDAVAFLTGNNVFSLKGDFVGKLYEDNQVWNGEYIGEVIREDRLVYNTKQLYERRPLPGMPGLPGFTGEPPTAPSILLPSGYQDVDQL